MVEDAAPGATFNTPTGIAFRPDGAILVAEKRGRVYLIENGAKITPPLWSRENEVLDQQDRGLLDVAVDPNYATNRYIYLLYTVDPDSNSTDNNNDAFARLTRYQVSAGDPHALVSSSRTILMGVDWSHAPLAASPTHTIGSIRWGEDGSMIVSSGDGGQYQGVDAGGRDPDAFGTGKTPFSEDIGAFRAQDINSLCGKILRLDPANGHGYPSNPYWDGDATSPRSRVWAYGVRNPFRIGLRPGTGDSNPSSGDPGTIYVGDVGWETWEEVTVSRFGGENFGWPCYEGFASNGSYQSANPAHHDCDTIGSGSNPASHTPPLLDWNHDFANQSHPSGYKGRAASGLCFYDGTGYPASYRGGFFHADYNDNWIRYVTVNGNDGLVSTQSFGTGMEGPVDIVAHPTSHDLYYVALTPGQIRRIRYTGILANNPPDAVADATPTIGLAPLQVSFSSAGSSDPNNDPLTFVWNFGDGESSNQAAPTHTYQSPGTYTAVLTAFDDEGAQDSDAVIVRATSTSTFPTTGVLDNFNRSNGPIGGAWVGSTSGLNIQNNALTQSSGWASTVWSGGNFGPDQEAFVTFDATTANAVEQDLMLKVQGLTWSAGHVEVRYDAPLSRVSINTYASSQGWEGRATLNGISFAPGDQFGARAYADGTVEVYKNGVAVGAGSVAEWPFFALGGYLGLTLDQATSTRLDNFGGGDAVLAFNTRPVATVLAPADSSFYIAPEYVVLSGGVSDAEDASGVLTKEWRVDLIHNQHTHPGVLTSTSLVDSFLTDDHDDGTGVHFDVWFIVTDTGGLKDTVRVSVFPEADLRPADLTVFPAEPISTTPTAFSFKIHNDGRLPAAISRWRLRAGGFLIAEGDTVVAALDSVTIARNVALSLAPGSYTLRATVDTLETVVETSETNNGAALPMTVVEGVLGAGAPMPADLTLSAALPNPTAGPASMDLALPRAARVALIVYDVAGRSVWRSPPRLYEPGRWPLAWDGTSRGRPVAPGLYLARVEIGPAVEGGARPATPEHVFVRRVSVMR